MQHSAGHVVSAIAPHRRHCAIACAAHCGRPSTAALSVGQRLPSSRVPPAIWASRVTVEAVRSEGEDTCSAASAKSAIIIAKSTPPATAAGIPRRSGQQIKANGGCREPQQPRVAAGLRIRVSAGLVEATDRTAPAATGRKPAALRRPAGYLPLREAIAAHVNQTRGVICDARRVIVLTSSQQALQLIATLLLDSGDSV